MVDANAFNLQPTIPMATIIDAMTQKRSREQAIRESQSKILRENLADIQNAVSTVAGSIVQKKQAMATAMLLKDKLDKQAYPQAQSLAQQDQMGQAQSLAQQQAITQANQVNARPVTTMAGIGPVSFGQTAAGGTGGEPVPNSSQPQAVTPEQVAAHYTAPTLEMIKAHLGTPSLQTLQTATMGLSPKDLLAHLIPQTALFGTINPDTGQVRPTMEAPRGSHFSVLPMTQPVMTEADALKAGSVRPGTRIIKPMTTMDQISWDTATPQQQSLAKGVYEGRIRPSDIGFRERGKITLLANEYATQNGLPPFKAYSADVNAAMGKFATSGKMGQNALSLNTALGHASSAYDSYQAMQNTNQAWLNKPINWLKKNTNDPNVVALGINLNALQGELANVFKNSGATDQEINHWRSYLNDDLTPSQYMGALGKIDELLRSRVNAMEYQRSTAGGDMGQSMLSPHAAEISQKLGGGIPTSNNVLSVGGTFHGQTIIGVRKKK